MPKWQKKQSAILDTYAIKYSFTHSVFSLRFLSIPLLLAYNMALRADDENDEL